MLTTLYHTVHYAGQGRWCPAVLRVADCRAAYAALMARGAVLLTPQHDWGGEIRCFLRDPDRHLVEISQSVPA